ncbi:MAG: hypothetical protein GQ574_14630 [Crocinitomix sp.]|nr:hypothetical protein [Crocinitomix sp.]
MAKTLLNITQEILSEMDSDEVNSISDTVESEQVANIVITSYRDMMSNRNWPHQRSAAVMTARGDSNYPTHMILSDDVKELISVRYNKATVGETQKRYGDVSYKSPDNFLAYTNPRNNDNSNVEVVSDDSGIDLLIVNDAHPTYYTSFDDTNVIFDSYHNGVDSSLQASKVQALGYILSELTFSDTATPTMPDEALSALIEESKSRAQLKLRQFQDVKSEGEASRQQRWLSRKAWKTNGGVEYPNYGKGR